MKLSIIIVNYKVERELIECIKSIERKVKGISYEIIVVENYQHANLAKKLSTFRNVKYLRSPYNLGFGGGNNFGASNASGEYLFFLNPDTLIIDSHISKFLKEFKRSVGIVAPVLYDQKNNIFPLQGTLRLNPIRAIFSLSIINKIWPNNPIARRYWLKGVDRSKNYESDVIPGTAFVISQKLFAIVGGFDKNYFLYFEEHDLCNRVRQLGYKIVTSPYLKVIHHWAQSTKKEKNINEIFNKSRFYYFQKFYGKPIAYITTWLMDFNLYSVGLIIAILTGAFLRTDRPELAMFIPDQGWFFLSAKDMLSGNIPLVGITSSHDWLHQGPLWTYLLAPILLLFNYNPYSGFYLAGFFGILSILLVYKIGSEFISKQFGLLSSMLYATSPLIVIHERMAYHTAPISFFVLLLIYFLIKWTRGNSFAFVICMGLMSILYNLELAAISFWSVIVLLLIWGFYKKKMWFKILLNKTTIIGSLAFLIVPMIPVIIYDLGHGFVQTVKFAAWVVYGPISNFFIGTRQDSVGFWFFSQLHLQRLIFLGSFYVSAILFVLSLIVSAKSVVKNIISPFGIIFATCVIQLIVFFVSKTPSEAYLPMFTPLIILCVSWFLLSIMRGNRVIGYLLINILVTANSYLVYKNDYLMMKPFGYGWPIKDEINASKQILDLAEGEKYNLHFDSPGAINNSTANYDYLTWWIDRNPSVKEEVVRKLSIYKDDHKIKVEIKGK